jgi:hypothetical protein
MRGASPRMTCLSIVIPAKAGIQLHRSKLDPDFRQGDEENREADKLPLRPSFIPEAMSRRRGFLFVTFEHFIQGN